MPKYFVYQTGSGQIVHIHEKVDFTSGESMPCTEEEVLAVVDESVRSADLGIIEADIGRLSVGELLRVDTKTRSVVQGSRAVAEG
jgi:hypothetical protein